MFMYREKYNLIYRYEDVYILLATSNIMLR